MKLLRRFWAKCLALSYETRASASVCVFLSIAGVAHAQLTPEHLYNPVHRPLTVEVALPERFTNTRCEVRIALLEPGTAREVASAPAAVGLVDLSTLFPSLWTPEEGGTPRVLYAQLVAVIPPPPPSAPSPPALGDGASSTAAAPVSVDEQPADTTPVEEKIGPALVLQPMLTPSYAPRVDRAGDPMFLPVPSSSASSRELGYTGLRVYVDQDVLFETSEGPMRVRLYPEAAANTVFAFRGLVEGGFYRDIEVHRIASLHGKAEPDIIQLGDPLGTGTGGPGFFIDLEPSTMPHDFGVLSMARSADPNSAGSQLFICLSRDGCAFLDGKYTTFARLIEGETPLLRIAASPVNPQNRPLAPPIIKSARLVDSPPYGEGAQPLVDPRRKPVER